MCLTETLLVLSACGHGMCESCLRRYVQTSGDARCPLCRGPLSLSTSVPPGPPVRRWLRYRLQPLTLAAILLVSLGGAFGIYVLICSRLLGGSLHTCL